MFVIFNLKCYTFTFLMRALFRRLMDARGFNAARSCIKLSTVVHTSKGTMHDIQLEGKTKKGKEIKKNKPLRELSNVMNP